MRRGVARPAVGSGLDGSWGACAFGRVGPAAAQPRWVAPAAGVRDRSTERRLSVVSSAIADGAGTWREHTAADPLGMASSAARITTSCLAGASRARRRRRCSAHSGVSRETFGVRPLEKERREHTGVGAPRGTQERSERIGTSGIWIHSSGCGGCARNHEVAVAGSEVRGSKIQVAPIAKPAFPGSPGTRARTGIESTERAAGFAVAIGRSSCRGFSAGCPVSNHALQPGVPRFRTSLRRRSSKSR
jgi:hypothetical protein